MKFGVADYGMNVWDGGLYDLEGRLTDLRKLGFDGVERLEANDSAEAVKRAAIYRKLGMDFATCRGPRIEQNLEWSAAFGCSYIWMTPGDVSRATPLDVFCRRARKFSDACRKMNLRAALHNHLGQVVQNQDELDIFMKEVPDAFLLLDIGHLFGAGGDVEGTLERYYDRLAAIHFKDVYIKDASLGQDRWSEKLRFCELGGGNAGFDCLAAAKILKRKHYDKWVLVEHDTHLREPLEDLRVSLDALKTILA